MAEEIELLPTGAEDDYQPDAPHKTAETQAARGIAAVLREVVGAINYVDFATLKVYEFERILKVAFSDRFVGASDEVLANELRCAPSTIASDRERPSYQAMLDKMNAALADLSHPRAIAEHVADLKNQDDLFRRTRRLAHNSRSERTTERALMFLLDRAAPVLQRQEKTTRVIHIQGTELERILGVARELEQLQAAPPRLIDVTPEPEE